MFRYLSPAVVTCFDDLIDPPVEPAAGDPPPAAPKTFTQEEVNKFVAEEKRKQQAALLKTEQTYKELLSTNQNLSAKERSTLEESLATVQGQLRTKDQQAALEKKQLEEQYTNKLTETEKQAKHWESMYRDSTVKRALLDAAVTNDAYRADQIVVLLQGATKLVEDTDANGRANGNFKVMVDFEDVDPTTNDKVMTTRTPEEAVKRMKELPEVYGNLFRSNVVSGIGANSSAAGYPAGANGKPDLRKLAQNPELFRKVMKENPGLIMNAKNNR